MIALGYERVDGRCQKLPACIFNAKEFMGTRFNTRHHLVEPNLKFDLPVQGASLAFPGGQAFSFNLDHCLEHGTADIRQNARFRTHVEKFQQSTIALQEANGRANLPFVRLVSLSYNGDTSA